MFSLEILKFFSVEKIEFRKFLKNGIYERLNYT